MNDIPSFVILHLRGVSASQLFLVNFSVSLAYMSYDKYDPSHYAKRKK